jgi:hypothetical protein
VGGSRLRISSTGTCGIRTRCPSPEKDCGIREDAVTTHDSKTKTKTEVLGASHRFEKRDDGGKK